LRVPCPAAGRGTRIRVRIGRSLRGDAPRNAGGVRLRLPARLAALGLLCLSAFSATEARAEVVVVDGERDRMQVSVDNDTVANVLQALEEKGNLRCRSSLPLNKVIGGSFSGSLGQVLSRVLVGFDFVVRYNPQGVEVVVYGESGAKYVPPPREEAYAPRPRPGSRTAAKESPGSKRAPLAPPQYNAPPAPGVATNP
jgi:hypothetical protein